MKSEDITGGLDLLGDWLDAKGYGEEAGLCTRAMDEINRLHQAMHDIYEIYAGSEGISRRPVTCAEAAETIEALRAKNARLCGVIGRLVNTVEYFNSTHKAGEARDIVAEARAEMDSDND